MKWGTTETLFALGTVVLVVDILVTIHSPQILIHGESDAFCHRMQQAVKDECAIAYENRLYDGGDTNYPREEHLKDIPLCDRMGNNLFNACRSGEYDKPTD